MERTAFRDVPVLRGHLRPRGHGRAATGGQGPRRRRGRVLARLPVPEGRRVEGPPRRPGPAAHADGPRRRRRAAAGELGGGVGAIAERLPALIETHGRDAVAVYIGNPAAHGLAALLYGRVLLKAIGTRSIYSASTVDQRPKEISSGLMFGARAVGPDPGRRPHAAPADAGRQPARVERLADDRAGHARPPARRCVRAAASSSSSIRAAAGPRSSPTSTTRSAPAPTRTCCSRSSTCCSPRAWRRPAGWRS